MLLQGKEVQPDMGIMGMLPTSQLHIRWDWVPVLGCEFVKVKGVGGMYYGGLFDERGCSTLTFECIRSMLQQADTCGSAADPMLSS